jgi:CheY-like chemotaxis protein
MELITIPHNMNDMREGLIFTTTMINKIVLMVDDDKENCLLAKEAFSKSGATANFLYVGNGIELMDYLSRHTKSEPDGLPDLILLDLNMPFMNGLEALRKIRVDQKFDNIPIVILTTSTETVKIVLNKSF